MDKAEILKNIESLSQKETSEMVGNDFLLTWDKSEDEIAATLLTAEILRALRRNNISSRVFETGLAISIFRDQSTRTRFSFASACNLLDCQSRSLMRKNHRLPTARPYGKQRI